MKTKAVKLAFVGAAAAAMLVGPTVAAATAAPMLHEHNGWYDPHCTHDGHWHNDHNDRWGHFDPRCRW